MTKRFEYSILPLNVFKRSSNSLIHGDENILNQAGANGWEIIFITQTVVIFERKLTRKRFKLWKAKKQNKNLM